MKTFFKSMGIAVAILAVVAGGIFLLKNTGVIDRAAANINAVEQVPPAPAPSTATPGPDGFPEGTWTVGRDIQPGTYRVAHDLDADTHCMWAIHKTGTNKREIVALDLPRGGRPTVTLTLGQDFTTSNCGSWVKE